MQQLYTQLKGRLMYISVNNSIGFKINQCANLINNYFINVLKPYHIAPEQRAILELLKNDNLINQTTISNLLGKDKTTISRAINALEKKGLLKRKSVLNNKRSNQIILTKEGESILEQSHMVVTDFREHFHSKLNKEEMKTLFMLLNKLTQK